MSEEFWQNGLKTIAAQVPPLPPITHKRTVTKPTFDV